MASMRDDRELFTTENQVDGLALRPGNGGADEDHHSLLAVASSALEGNLWGGGVDLLAPTTGERLGGCRLAAGIGALAWGGEDSNVLALGCDNGDLQLLRLTTTDTGDFSLVPVPHTPPAASSPSSDDGDTREPTTSAASGCGGHAPGHDDVISGLAVSAFERNMLATSSWDLTVKIWDLAAMGTARTTLEGHGDLIWDLALSPAAAHRVATASQDATVQIWDERAAVQAAGSTLATPHAALAVDWHPTREHIVAAGLADGSVVVFDLRAPAASLSSTLVHKVGIHRLAYSPTHVDALATGGDDAQVFLVSGTAGGTEGSTSTVQELKATHSDYVRALAWAHGDAASSSSSSSSSFLFTGSWDRRVCRLEVV